MAVARHHLGGDRLALQPEAPEHARLELWAGGRVGADRAGDPADRHLREGALQAQGVAVRLERQARQLHAERRRLGVHPVRAPHAQRLHVLARARRQRLRERAGARHDRFARRLQLQRERRVEDVRGGQSEVDPAPRLAGGGGEHVDERSHVVVGRALALVDRRHSERRPADRLQVGLGGAVAGAEQERQLLARRHLHLAPRLHACLVGPDRAQLGAGVALDHVLEYHSPALWAASAGHAATIVGVGVGVGVVVVVVVVGALTPSGSARRGSLRCGRCRGPRTPPARPAASARSRGSRRGRPPR